MCKADSIRDESPCDGVDGGAMSSSTNTSETSISCANCGIKLSATFRFCTECGHQVGDTTASFQRSCNKVYDSEDASSVSDDGLSSATQFVPMMAESTYQDAGMFMAGLPPYAICVHPVGTIERTSSTPLKASAPSFVPNQQAICSPGMPVMNDVLHGVLEEIAPGVMTEMRKSSKSCESLLLQAMPDHYDD